MEGKSGSSHHNNSSGGGGLLDVNKNAYKPKRTISFQNKQANPGQGETNKNQKVAEDRNSSCLKCSLL
jgi:hypothetical protein